MFSVVYTILEISTFPLKLPIGIIMFLGVVDISSVYLNIVDDDSITIIALTNFLSIKHFNSSLFVSILTFFNVKLLWSSSFSYSNEYVDFL